MFPYAPPPLCAGRWVVSHKETKGNHSIIAFTLTRHKVCQDKSAKGCFGGDAPKSHGGTTNLNAEVLGLFANVENLDIISYCE
jgi:hypothetical protein